MSEVPKGHAVNRYKAGKATCECGVTFIHARLLTQMGMVIAHWNEVSTRAR